MALTSTIIKCLERLVMAPLKSNLPSSLDLLQFAYCHNRPTASAIFLALHSSWNSWARKTPILTPSRRLQRFRL